MPVSSQSSLSLELTRLYPAHSALPPTSATLIKLARELKQNGSDILVEEDLATIFGRAKIALSIENHFKDVISLGSFCSLTPGSEIILDAGPGATVRRALQDRYHLATVLQLSFLVWMNEPTSLASNIVEAMRKRFDLKVHSATPSPDFEGILRSLEVIQSQTSQYPWEYLIEHVESRFPSSQAWLHMPSSPLKQLPSNVLLAAMDYLYLVQSPPENRYVEIEGQMGMIPMIVWANCILGLSVDVQGHPDGQIHFEGTGEQPKQVVIKWEPETETVKYPLLPPPTICLMDAETVVLATRPEDFQVVELGGEERLRLEGYLYKILRRLLNASAIIPEGHPLNSESVHFILAAAFIQAKKLRREVHGSDPGNLQYISSNIEIWRIREAAEITFKGSQICWDLVSSYIDELLSRDGSFRLPPTLQKFSETAWQHRFAPRCWTKRNPVQFIRILSGWLLIFAQIVDIKTCSQLPLTCDVLSFKLPFTLTMEDEEWINVESDLWFESIAYLLMGQKYGTKLLGDRDPNKYCLISARGWSVYIAPLFDNDPAEINCESVFVKQGVPTSSKTQECRYLITDAPPMHPEYPPQGPNLLPRVVDNAGSYIPRCVTPVLERIEFWEARSKEFSLSIRYNLEERLSGNNHPYSLYVSPRQLYDGLKGVFRTDTCSHEAVESRQEELYLNVATASGFQWWLEEQSTGPIKNKRICICLVKDDARARWLVLGGIFACGGLSTTPRLAGFSRSVLLRSADCCVSCAVQKASESPGKWLVIL